MKTFCLSVTFSAAGGLGAEAGADFGDGYLRLESRGSRWRVVRPEPGRLVALWGAAALDGRIDDARVAAHLCRARDIGAAARDLNGSLLAVIYDTDRHRLSIVNDRFGARPFFYTAEGGIFRGATSFKQLFDAAGGGQSPGLDPAAMFEFLYFRRVFGTKTYDRAIRFLPYASVLTLGEGEGVPRHVRYWRPRFEKSGLGVHEFSDQLAEAIRDSVALYTSDARRFGLMLSGGLDARAILAASSKPPVCFTNTPVKNNEWAVAAELAAIAGAQHVYVPRPERFLDGVVDGSVYLSGGMTIYGEAQFANYEAAIAPRADAVMLGLALDIMFCGHYLPKSHPTVLGRPAWHFELRPLGADLAKDFIETVSYRLKTSDPFSVVRPEKRRPLADHLRATVEEVMAEGRDCGARDYDLWEFMHLHNFARHYSLLMAASIEPYAEARIPAMENRLYELVCAMPVGFKTNWHAYLRALTRLSPAMMAVRNANTNIAARYPLPLQSWIKFARAAANRALGTRFAAAPAWWDRSWPEPRQSIAANPGIRAAVAALPDSERLAALGLFEPRAIRAAVEDHMAGRHDHAVLLNLLLTLERALTPQAETRPRLPARADA